MDSKLCTQREIESLPTNCSGNDCDKPYKDDIFKDIPINKSFEKCPHHLEPTPTDEEIKRNQKSIKDILSLVQMLMEIRYDTSILQRRNCNYCSNTAKLDPGNSSAEPPVFNLGGFEVAKTVWTSAVQETDLLKVADILYNAIKEGVLDSKGMNPQQNLRMGNPTTTLRKRVDEPTIYRKRIAVINATGFLKLKRSKLMPESGTIQSQVYDVQQQSKNWIRYLSEDEKRGIIKLLLRDDK